MLVFAVVLLRILVYVNNLITEKSTKNHQYTDNANKEELVL